MFYTSRRVSLRHGKKRLIIMAEEEKSDAEKIKKLGDLIADINLAMLTTVDESGALRSRPMRYRQAEGGFDGKIYFFTDASSGKIADVEHDQRVNVAFANPKNQDYVSISGTGRLSRDRAKMEELWNPLFKAWFPDGLEDPDIALFIVEAEGAEYWDAPTSPVAHLIGFVKAKATGQPPRVGEDEKVTITPGAVAEAKTA